MDHAQKLWSIGKMENFAETRFSLWTTPLKRF